MCPVCGTQESQLRCHYRKYHPTERFPITTADMHVHGTYETVEALLVLQRQEDALWTWSTTASRVYFILAGSAGRPVKIGHSRNLPNRLVDLQLANPDPLHVLITYEGSRKDERELHKRFEKHWIAGEWFRSGPEILDFVWDRLNLGT